WAKAAPIFLASSAISPGASALTARAAASSVSAWSTPVYAAAFTISWGRTSLIVLRISLGFERSNCSRPSATTSPSWGKRRKSSPPTCPFFPVSKITGFISPRTPVGALGELERELGTLRLSRRQSGRLRPSLSLGQDHSRRCHARPLRRRTRCICKEIELCPRELRSRGRTLSEHKSDFVRSQKEARLSIFRRLVSPLECQLQRQALHLLRHG